MQIPNENIRASLTIARELIDFADRGQSHSQDDGCIVLYGLVRDCGHRIRAEAERERRAHQAMGVWEDGSSR